MGSASKASAPLFTAEQLRRLILPLMLEQLLAMTVGAADTVMLSRVGEAAVSGVALVDVINNLVIQVLAALATGGAVVCSQYLGRQDEPNARLAAKNLLYTATAFALALAAVMLVFRIDLLFLIFGAVEEAVMESAKIYALLTALSFPFLAVYNACASMFRSMGNSRVSLRASLLMNAVNIGGNALLIYGFDMGAAGAATATLVSRAVAAVMMLVLIRNRSYPIWLDRLLAVRFERRMVGAILRIGIPSGLENGLFHFGKLLLQSLIASLGTAAVAANAIVNSICGMLIVPGMSIGLSMITVVGQCVGANEYAQAKRYTWQLTGLTFAAMSLVNLPMLLIARPLIGLFSLSDEAAMLAIGIMPVLGVMQSTLWPMSFAFPNALRAAGDARYTMLVSVISMFFARVGLGYIFIRRFGMSVEGVWYAMYIDWVVRSVCFTLRYIGGRWRNKRVIA